MKMNLQVTKILSTLARAGRRLRASRHTVQQSQQTLTPRGGVFAGVPVMQVLLQSFSNLAGHTAGRKAVGVHEKSIHLGIQAA